MKRDHVTHVDSIAVAHVTSRAPAGNKQTGRVFSARSARATPTAPELGACAFDEFNYTLVRYVPRCWGQTARQSDRLDVLSDSVRSLRVLSTSHCQENDAGCRSEKLKFHDGSFPRSILVTSSLTSHEEIADVPGEDPCEDVRNKSCVSINAFICDKRP